MAEPFNPNEHLSKLRGKDYLEVKYRLLWFLNDTPSRAGIITIELEHDRQNGYARYTAVAWDGKDDTWRILKIHGHEVAVCGRVGMGTKSETKADFPDFAEKAETGAKGRALADLGYGTQFAVELEEGARVVDSPVEGRPGQARPQAQASQKAGDEPPADEQQLLSIHKLCIALGREEPAPGVLNYAGAGALIRQLSKEYNTRRRAS